MGQKVIRSACGSASTGPGIRAGSRTRPNMGSFCTRTWRSRGACIESEAGGNLEDHYRASTQEMPVTIHSARPGVVIGKKGADIDKIRKLVAKMRIPKC